MLRIAFLVLLLFGQSRSYAQTWAFELWHAGRVITDTGDTLVGKVKYNLQQDLVQLDQEKGPPEIFTARKLLHVEIFDATVRRYRNFYSLPYALQGNYRTPVLFELLVEGKITVLARESLEYRTTNSSFYYNRMIPVLVYSYFYLEPNGDIVPFKPKKDEILAAMGNKAEQVQKFSRQNNLRFDDHGDLIRIIKYYNSLF